MQLPELRPLLMALSTVQAVEAQSWFALFRQGVGLGPSDAVLVLCGHELAITLARWRSPYHR